MDYQKKVEYAERVANQLQGQKTTEEIKSILKTEGLYDRDISNIMVSARKILGETYQPKIKKYLLESKEIHDAEEFNSLDKEMLETLITQESQNITLEERRKLTKLVKEGHSPEKVLEQVDQRFLSIEEASTQIASLQEVKNQNSGSGRMLSIGGGIGLILLTGVIVFTTGRLFYFLPILGFIMIGKGIFTERMAYED